MDVAQVRDRIEAVANTHAAHDSLLTIALPSQRQLGEAVERIETDRAVADRPDSNVPGPVCEALNRAHHRLTELDVPDDGLVLYVGADEAENIHEWIFDDLPDPISEFTYVRDDEFDTAPLDASIGSEPVYGLLIVERGGAALGLFRDGVTPLVTLDSGVMGKTRAGGQSADRFERRRAEQKAKFFESVATKAEHHFLDERNVDGLLTGGTTVTIDEFLDGDYLDYRLADRLLGDPVSVDHASERGLRELARQARDRREAFERQPVERALDRFFTALGNDDPVAYGANEVDRALTFGAVKTLLVSVDLPTADRHEYEARVEDEGGTHVVVPTEIDRGERFRDAFDGLGALLRFPID